ncbi:hypothetical protein, partial [Parabacteroides sp.]
PPPVNPRCLRFLIEGACLGIKRHSTADYQQSSSLSLLFGSFIGQQYLILHLRQKRLPVDIIHQR